MQAVNVCFAVDQSGYICSLNQSNAQLCESCDCRSDDIPTFCCPNYVSAKNFTIATINGVQSVTSGTYGIFHFATLSNVVTPLTTNTIAINAINTLSYTGGWTNTKAGIRNCDAVPGAAINRVLVILTNGNPTVCTQGPVGNDCAMDNPDDSATTTAANNAATTARNDNITIISVGVGSETAISNQNLLN
jgi:hypothetical protein